MGESYTLTNSYKINAVMFNCGEINDLEKDLIKLLNKNLYDMKEKYVKINIGGINYG